MIDEIEQEYTAENRVTRYNELENILGALQSEYERSVTAMQSYNWNTIPLDVRREFKRIAGVMSEVTNEQEEIITWLGYWALEHIQHERQQAQPDGDQ